MNRSDNEHFINSLLNSDNNEIMILYGSRYVGIRSFVFEQLKNREYFYYKAIPCDLKLQMNMIVSDLSDKVSYSSKNIKDLALLIKEYSEIGNSKKIIVIDEFQHIYRENTTLFNYLISIIRESCPKGSISIILACENEDYINNDFLPSNPPSLYELSGIFNVSEMSPMEAKKKYKKFSFSELIYYYSILGGNANLWDKIILQDAINIKDFIPSFIISPKGILYDQINHILPSELRETAVYNTILYYMASGYNKLNDLFAITGYSRAKISVYIKNLIDLGLVKKAVPQIVFDQRVHKKGVYYIPNNFVRFYYYLIFPNISKMPLISAEKFSKKYVEPGMSVFRESAYLEYIIQHLKELYSQSEVGYFYDKNNTIDIAVKTSDEKIILCACQFASPHMSYSRLEKMLKTCDEYDIKYDEIMLFSAVDFDQKLRLYSSLHNEVKLIYVNH